MIDAHICFDSKGNKTIRPFPKLLCSLCRPASESFDIQVSEKTFKEIKQEYINKEKRL